MAKKVMIVDDSPMVRKLLSFKLQGAGYHVTAASDGAEALNLCPSADPDLVITDLNMPEMDGLTLIQQIRNSEDYKYLPVVLFITNHPEDQEHINTSGATALLVKDQVNHELLPTVKKLIR